jgi:DNA-binding GntR family transcriptional regulator
MEFANLARDEVYRRLRADIISCRLPPGTELREAQLAERFDVSKSPVRDALHRLEVEQLVNVLPRRGYQIAPISVRDAQELRELRSVVEQACARKAAELASDADLRALDSFRDFKGRTEEDFIAYNRAFHEAITVLSGNRRMADYSRNLGEQHDRLVRVSISRSSSRDYDGFVREHGEIIVALQARDGRKAARLVHKHIKNGEKRIVSALSRAAIVP